MTTDAKLKPYSLTPEKLDEIVRRIVAQFDPRRIILFGSHARGDCTPDSDVDLLVVFDEVASKRSRAVEIGVALADMLVAKDILVAASDEIASPERLRHTVLHDAVTEGRTIYERS